MGDGERQTRFSRQLRLDGVGPEGQERLAAASVLVVGAGGLGAPVLQHLAGAGVGRLLIADDDRVELSNLNRQTLHRASDVGRLKAERAAEWVAALDPALDVEPIVDRISVHNARALVGAVDLVVDCVDGLPSKYLVQDAAVLEGRPCVHGAVTAWSGQALFIPPGGQPCLRCLYPDIPPPAVVQTCQTAGVLGAACGLVGGVMGLMAVQHLAGLDVDAGRLLSVDARSLSLTPMTFAASPACPVCGPEPEIDGSLLEDYRPGPR